MKPLRILITGAAGLLAAPIIKQLKSKADLVLTDIKQGDCPEKITIADLTDLSQATEIMKNVDVVVHLAIVSPYHIPNEDPEKEAEWYRQYEQRMLAINPPMMYNVFDAARHNGVRRVVYASSLTVHYGDKSKQYYSASTYPNPQNIYACLKYLGENIAEFYSRTYGLETISIRFGQPYPNIISPKHDNEWREGIRQCSAFITIEDVGRIVEAAVYSDIVRPVVYGVSESDYHRYDMTQGYNIGYVPTGKFTPKRLLYRAPGTKEWIPSPYELKYSPEQ